jgi:hypothetical protein
MGRRTQKFWDKTNAVHEEKRDNMKNQFAGIQRGKDAMNQ